MLRASSEVVSRIASGDRGARSGGILFAVDESTAHVNYGTCVYGTCVYGTSVSISRHIASSVLLLSVLISACT